MRNLMKFNRFVMPLLLIIFSALLHGCTLNENVSYKSAYADNNLSVKNENINGAIVKVMINTFITMKFFCNSLEK